MAEQLNNSYIHIENLSKSFGFNKVLDGINLQFEKGDIVALFGPNGAGKTTLIRILSTIIKGDEGSISISGFDIKNEVQNIRNELGLLSHENFLYQNLTVSENLIFFAKLYKIKNHEESISKKLNSIGIYSKRNELVRNLSSGMKQRVSVVRTLIHDPNIVLLDEPFVGLDIEGCEYLLQILSDLKKENKTIIVTTHDLKLGLHECNKVIVISNGKIRLNESIENIDVSCFEGTYKSLIANRIIP